MKGDYEHLDPGWRAVCELLADIRDQLERDVDYEVRAKPPDFSGRCIACERAKSAGGVLGEPK